MLRCCSFSFRVLVGQALVLVFVLAVLVFVLAGPVLVLVLVLAILVLVRPVLVDITGCHVIVLNLIYFLHTPAVFISTLRPAVSISVRNP